MYKKIIIIGVGGTGGNLAPMLARFTPERYSLHLIDGDIVEESNTKRQPYQHHDIGMNKAEALAIKINSSTPKDNTTFTNTYLKTLEQTKKLFAKIFENISEAIVISCVDNHPARILIEKTTKEYKGKILYIDSANEEWHGEIISCYNLFDRIVYEKNEMKWVGKFRSQIWPKIKRSKEGDRAKLRCGQIIDSGGTQQYSCNMQAANICLQLVNDWVNDCVNSKAGITFFDVKKLEVNHLCKKPKESQGAE